MRRTVTILEFYQEATDIDDLEVYIIRSIYIVNGRVVSTVAF